MRSFWRRLFVFLLVFEILAAGKAVFGGEGEREAAREFIFPDSGRTLLSGGELEGLPLPLLAYGRYEIYARKGVLFDSEELSAFFSSQPWYFGFLPEASFDDSYLSEVEQKNAALLEEAERRADADGYRLDQGGGAAEMVRSYLSGDRSMIGEKEDEGASAAAAESVEDEEPSAAAAESVEAAVEVPGAESAAASEVRTAADAAGVDLVENDPEILELFYTYYEAVTAADEEILAAVVQPWSDALFARAIENRRRIAARKNLSAYSGEVAEGAYVVLLCYEEEDEEQGSVPGFTAYYVFRDAGGRLKAASDEDENPAVQEAITSVLQSPGAEALIARLRREGPRPGAAVKAGESESVPEEPESAAETPESMSEEAESVPEIPESITEEPENAEETPESVTEELESAAETPESITEEPESVPEPPDSIAEESESAPETTKSAAESTESEAETAGGIDPFSEYIFPEVQSRYLTRAEAERLTLQAVCYAKNEIYALHGQKFVSAELQEYFQSKSWYQGFIEESEFSDFVLNDYEQENLALLSDVEREKAGNGSGYPLDRDGYDIRAVGTASRGGEAA